MYKFITLFVISTVFAACGPKVDPTLKSQYESFSSTLQRASLDTEQVKASLAQAKIDTLNPEIKSLIEGARTKSQILAAELSKNLGAVQLLFQQYSEGKISEEEYKTSFKKIKDNMSGVEDDVQRLGSYLSGQKVGAK